MAQSLYSGGRLYRFVAAPVGETLSDSFALTRLVFEIRQFSERHFPSRLDGKRVILANFKALKRERKFGSKYFKLDSLQKSTPFNPEKCMYHGEYRRGRDYSLLINFS